MANSLETKGTAKNESTLNKKEAALIRNRKVVLTAIVAVIIIIAGYLAYNTYYAQPREDEASTAMAKGQEYMATQQFDKALNGDGAGFKGFKAIATDYSGTKAANLANLYAGQCCAQLDKWKEAQTYLENYSAADDQMVSPAAIMALGDAYANNNLLDKAVETFKKAAKMADSESADGANNSISPTCLIKAGEILESQNKKDEALQIYQEIKKKYVNSAAYQEIDKYIERATK